MRSKAIKICWKKSFCKYLNKSDIQCHMYEVILFYCLYIFRPTWAIIRRHILKENDFKINLNCNKYFLCNITISWRIWSFARQQFDKHHLKAGIATEGIVHLLGNDSLVRVPPANINKDVPVTTEEWQINGSVKWLTFGPPEIIKQSLFVNSSQSQIHS
jgi:hypothetical protein